MTAQDRLTLRNGYLYLVCLITLVVGLFAAVSLVRSAVALIDPGPGQYDYYGYYPYPGDPGTEGVEIDPQERERQEQLAVDAARRDALQEFVGSATSLLIAVPVYVYHWRRVQRELPWRNSQQVAGGPPFPGGAPYPGGAQAPAGQQVWGGQQAPGGQQVWGGQQGPGGQQAPGGQHGPGGPPAP